MVVFDCTAQSTCLRSLSLTARPRLGAAVKHIAAVGLAYFFFDAFFSVTHSLDRVPALLSFVLPQVFFSHTVTPLFVCLPLCYLWP